AAYRMAAEHTGSPTVILAKTVKGWTLGSSVEARNATHQVKKMTVAEWSTFRDRLHMEIPDDALSELAPYARPTDDSPELAYLQARRNVLNGALPKRTATFTPIAGVPDTVWSEFHAGTSPKLTASTTTAF